MQWKHDHLSIIKHKCTATLLQGVYFFSHFDSILSLRLIAIGTVVCLFCLMYMPPISLFKVRSLYRNLYINSGSKLNGKNRQDSWHKVLHNCWEWSGTQSPMTLVGFDWSCLWWEVPLASWWLLNNLINTYVEPKKIKL